MAGPLTGFRILDLTWGITGPFATMLMADNGGDVVRISPPLPFREGDRGLGEHPGYPVWNRGKQSLLLDLKRPEGVEVLHRLLAKADALVESFQPGEMDKLGLGYDALRAKYPRLVYTSVSAYGQHDKDRDRPGYDGLVQARMGLQHYQRGYREGPIYLGWPMPSYSSAFLVVIGTVTALLVRQSTGRGQHVDTSLRDGALAMLTMNWNQAEKGAEKFATPVWKKRLLVELFQCADGEWLHLHTGAQGAFERLMEGFGFPEYVNTPMTEESWAVMFPRAVAWFKARPRSDGLAMLLRQDIPSLPVYRPGGAMREEQSRVMNFVETVHDPVLGDLEQIGLGLRFEKTPTAIKGGAPTPGQHTDKLLASAGVTAADIKRLRSAGVVG